MAIQQVSRITFRRSLAGRHPQFKDSLPNWLKGECYYGGTHHPQKQKKSQGQQWFTYIESRFSTDLLTKSNGYRRIRHWNKSCSLRMARERRTHWIRMSNTATRMTTALNTPLNFP
jgi:hypothetical protein